MLQLSQLPKQLQLMLLKQLDQLPLMEILMESLVELEDIQLQEELEDITDL
jgi:hypothetical protein